MSFKKNVDMHTDQTKAEARILKALSRSPTCPASALGYVAFPGYHFKRPQGAAFAVSKILSSMVERKLIRRERRQFEITAAGQKACEITRGIDL